jgi:3-deoxy-D-manno-octulosonate 8-phosphate phosphatase (KDO 8-P phosphatase)
MDARDQGLMRTRRGAAVTGRARKIRLLVMDIDGVLTDGRMILSERGDELKAFCARDGVAIALARRAGLGTALVTGESSSIGKVRGTRLGIERVLLGVRRKGDTVEQLMLEQALAPEAVAYVGDDLLDIPALQRCGLAVAVADAAPEVRMVAHYVTRARGGQGVVRELVELILRAQRIWTATVDKYVEDHGGRSLSGT